MSINDNSIFVMNGKDYTPMLISEGFSVKYSPVYDASGFTALDGTVYSSLKGHSVRITFQLEYLDDEAASELAEILERKTVEISWSAPDETTADAVVTEYVISPFVTVGTKDYWTAAAVLDVPFIALDGL